jgi:hypothetical protein
MTRPGVSCISLFFIVADCCGALSFHRDMLAFEVTFQGPVQDQFFAIVCRDGAMIMVKSVRVEPLPNCKRQPQARWDAYLYVPDPDALAAEFASRGVSFSVPLNDTYDGLRGFEHASKSAAISCCPHCGRLSRPWVGTCRWSLSSPTARRSCCRASLKTIRRSRQAEKTHTRVLKDLLSTPAQASDF